MKKLLAVIYILLIWSIPLWAQEPEQKKEETDREVHLLDEVKVEKDQEELGQATIEGKALEMTPNATGSVTGALKGMSNVQYSYSDESGQTLGEIAPPSISISGAKTYENSFLIDGMSITNTLNPSGLADKATVSSLAVGGAEQSIFYNTDLVEGITVFTSNIPAEYGDFVGGVVSATLKDPRKDRWHYSLSTLYTTDKWFHQRDTEDDSEEADNQPEFSIYTGQLSADGPINENTSAMISLSRKYSVIPLMRQDNNDNLYKDDQYRISDNFFTRVVTTPSDRLKLKFDATYAPYEEDRWTKAWEKSEWSAENDSSRFSGQAEYLLDSGTLTAKTAFSMNGYSRDSDTNYRYTILDYTGGNAGDKGGGVGNLEVDNKEVDFQFGYKSNPVKTGDLVWDVASGLSYGYATTDSRAQSAEVYTKILYASTSSLESYETHAYYDGASQSSDLQTLGFYVQSDLDWHRLHLTPGIRVDYDDFSGNIDIAPRFKAEYDVMGNGRARLITGANRYYGSTLRAYAFDRYRTYTADYTRVYRNGTVVNTSKTGTDHDYNAGNLDTPYSDEAMTGVAGSLAGFSYGLELVYREHKDQLASYEGDDSQYYMTNDGKSTYKGLTMSLSKALPVNRFGSHTLSLSATKSKTETFNGTYDSETDLTTTSAGYSYNYDMVYYNGKYISRSDLPADDYNAPWVIALTVGSNFFNNRLRLQTVARWRDDSWGLKDNKQDSSATPYGTTTGNSSSSWITSDGEYADSYIEGGIKGGLVTNVTVEWDAYIKDRFRLTLVGEVVNLFDSYVETSVSETGSVTGRGFYAGVKAEF